MITDRSGLRCWRAVNAAVERALMPYFQRSSLNDRTLPISGAPSSDVGSGVPTSIVEQAAEILDRETARDAAKETTAAGVIGGAGRRDNDLLPIADIPALADLQKRASEVFAAFLEGFARSPSLAASGVPTGTPAREPATTVPLVAAGQPVKAGEAATVAVKLVNDRGTPVNLILYSTDFVSDTGSQIPTSHVTFSPRTLALAGRAQGGAQMKISIPAQSAPGLYSALVQAAGPDARAPSWSCRSSDVNS